MNSLTKTEAATPDLIAPDLVQMDASGRPRLRIGCCRACGALSFPLVQVCACCLSEDIGVETTDGSGELYAYSIVHQAPGGWIVPYALGYVDLPNGLRVLGHIDTDFERLRSGLPVGLSLAVVRRGSDGEPIHSYAFRPAE